MTKTSLFYAWHNFRDTKLLKRLLLTTLQCRRRSKDLFSLITHTRHYISLLSTPTPYLALQLHYCRDSPPLLRFRLIMTVPGYRRSIILSVFGETHATCFILHLFCVTLVLTRSSCLDLTISPQFRIIPLLRFLTTQTNTMTHPFNFILVFYLNNISRFVRELPTIEFPKTLS